MITQQINKLCLGTAQFGLNYGIINKNGKPSREKIFEILDIAIKEGVTCFDTANSYGNSEEILGEYISSRRIEKKVKIVSKLQPEFYKKTETNLYSAIKSEIIKSCKKLRIKHLNGFLLHNPKHIYDREIIELLIKYKKEGLVENIGVSIYDPEDALYAININFMDYIQIPFNVFDQRLLKTNFFEIAEQKGIVIFARSTLLQGLLMAKNEEIPPYLQNVKKYLVLFDNIINKYKVSRIRAAIHFVSQRKEIGFLIFGVDNEDQLMAYINEIKYGYLPMDCIKELENTFNSVEENIINPTMWNKKLRI